MVTGMVTEMSKTAMVPSAPTAKVSPLAASAFENGSGSPSCDVPVDRVEELRVVEVRAVYHSQASRTWAT